jgi:hypothetical protein
MAGAGDGHSEEVMDASAANVVRFGVPPRLRPMSPEAQVELLMRLARAGQFDDLELAIRLALSVAHTKDKK